MITKPNEVSIAVKRIASRTSDGAGGYVVGWSGTTFQVVQDLPSRWRILLHIPQPGDSLTVDGITFTWYDYRLLDGGGPEPYIMIATRDGEIIEVHPADEASIRQLQACLNYPQSGLLSFCEGITYSAYAAENNVIQIDGAQRVDAAGIAGSPFAGRLIRKAAIRTGALIDAPQGSISREEIVLAFPAGSDIRQGDVCTVNGIEYTVQTVRPYTRSLQADVLAVH